MTRSSMKSHPLSMNLSTSKIHYYGASAKGGNSSTRANGDFFSPACARWGNCVTCLSHMLWNERLFLFDGKDIELYAALLDCASIFRVVSCLE